MAQLENAETTHVSGCCHILWQQIPQVTPVQPEELLLACPQVYCPSSHQEALQSSLAYQNHSGIRGATLPSPKDLWQLLGGNSRWESRGSWPGSGPQGLTWSGMASPWHSTSGSCLLTRPRAGAPAREEGAKHKPPLDKELPIWITGTQKSQSVGPASARGRLGLSRLNVFIMLILGQGQLCRLPAL